MKQRKEVTKKKQVKNAYQAVEFIMRTQKKYWYPWEIHARLLIDFNFMIAESTITRYFRAGYLNCYRKEPPKHSPSKQCQFFHPSRL